MAIMKNMAMKKNFMDQSLYINQYFSTFFYIDKICFLKICILRNPVKFSY